MKLFEKEKHSSRSKMNPIEIEDVLEDIKYSSTGSDNAKELIENGYLSFIHCRDDFNGNTCYFAKPSKEVKDHMAKAGYGAVSGMEYSNISNAISFHSTWKSTSITMTTTPQIAGVLDDNALKQKLNSLPYEGDCQVNIAYSKMYAVEPNYALRSINITGQTLDKMKKLSRNIWLAAGFMLNDNDITSKANNGDFDMAFKNHEQMKFLEDNFKFEKPFYIPENKVKNKKTRSMK